MIRLKDDSLNFLQAMNLGCTSNGVRLENINNETKKKVIDNDSKNGYVIVSPCCGYEQSGIEPCGEGAKLALSDFNMKRIAEVMTTCKENKFRYMPIFGRFTQNNEEWYEAAFIIYPYWTNDKPHTFDELQTFAIGLAKRFNQGTILIKRPGEKPVYVTKEGKEGSMLSFPSYKVEDKWYTHVWFPISRELQSEIEQKITARLGA